MNTSSHTHTMVDGRDQETRTRGTILRALDVEALSERALEIANAALTPQDREAGTRWTRMAPEDRWAIADGPNGELFAICSEGVGYTVTDEQPFTMPLLGSWVEGGKAHRGMTPNYEAKLTPADLRAMAGEDIDLADLVREFGDRLESNFSLWFGRLNGTRR